MRRFISILFLINFLLTGVGQYVLLIGLKEKAGKDLSRRLEGDMYTIGGSMTVKVPLGLPYVTDQFNYEPASGTFEGDGEVYQIIKKRIYQDTLYIVCLKDPESTKLNDAVKAFVESFSGENEDGDQDIASKLAKEYLSTEVVLKHLSNGWEISNQPGPWLINFSETYQAKIKHPPTV